MIETNRTELFVLITDCTEPIFSSKSNRNCQFSQKNGPLWFNRNLLIPTCVCLCPYLTSSL